MEDQRQESWRRVCLWKAIQENPQEGVFTGYKQGNTWIFLIFSSLPASKAGNSSPPPHREVRAAAQPWRWDGIYPPLQSCSQKKKPHSIRPVCYFTERNSHKFPQIQAKAAARGSAPSMGSPKGGAPGPSELHGRNAARYHGVHGKIQQLFKCYDLCCIST